MDFDDSIFRNNELGSPSYRGTAGSFAAARRSGGGLSTAAVQGTRFNVDDIAANLPNVRPPPSVTPVRSVYDDPLSSMMGDSTARRSTSTYLPSGSEARSRSRFRPSPSPYSTAGLSAARSAGAASGSEDQTMSPEPFEPEATAPDVTAAHQYRRYTQSMSPGAGFETPTRERSPSRDRGTPARTPAAGVEEIDFDEGRGTSSAKTRRRTASANPTAAMEARSPQVKRFVSAMHSATAGDADLRPRSASGIGTSGGVELHADDHIMRRRFRIAAEAVGGVSPDTTSVTCEITRVLSAPPRGLLDDADDDDAHRTASGANAITFTCEDELSSVVNIGDSAHCRVIDLRTAYAAEKAAQKAMCAATTSLTMAIDTELAALLPAAAAAAAATQSGDSPINPFFPGPDGASPEARDPAALAGGAAAGVETPVEQVFASPGAEGMKTAGPMSLDDIDGADEDDAHQRRPTTTESNAASSDQSTPPSGPAQPSAAAAEPDAYDFGKALIPHCDEASREVLSALLSSVSTCSAAGARHVAQVLDALAKEASGRAVDAHLRSFDAEHHWHAAQQLGLREAEAKTQGNLALCAQLRRELVTTLSAAVNEAIDCTEVAQSPFTELSPARRGTTSVLDAALSECSRHASVLHEAKREAAERSNASQTALEQLRDRHAQKRAAVMGYLADNDREIATILSELDRLYNSLELAVHTRNNKVKAFVKERAATSVAEAVALRRTQSLTDAERTLDERLAAASASVEAASTCSTLVTSVRTHVESRQTEQKTRMASDAEATAQQCLDLYGELQTCVAGWTDVLLKNAARERDREAQLRASIDEATERYHQSDRDMYQSQLVEAERRRKLTEAEVTACEEILRKCTARLDKVGLNGMQHHHHQQQYNNGSSSRPATAGSRPVTPQRTAAPRFAHQLDTEGSPAQHEHTGPRPSHPPSSGASPAGGARLDVGAHDVSGALVAVDQPTQRLSLDDPNEGMFAQHSTMSSAAPQRPAAMELAVVRGDVPHPAALAAMHTAVDAMLVRELVAVFGKSSATKAKWSALLEDLDVEVGADLRGIYHTADVWATFLPDAPLLKSLLEQLLTDPSKFVDLEEDSPSPPPPTATTPSFTPTP